MVRIASKRSHSPISGRGVEGEEARSGLTVSVVASAPAWRRLPIACCGVARALASRSADRPTTDRQLSSQAFPGWSAIGAAAPGVWRETVGG